MVYPTAPLTAYRQPSAIIDSHHPAVAAQAQQLAARGDNPILIARTCFEWVRDTIHHSVDHQLNPVTWRASDVLRHRTGYCYAKSHLLVALLRANAIPAGFCYQRLSIDDQGAPYCLHGLVGVYLPIHGWYRIDPRGNRPGVNAQFCPPQEQLAFALRWPGEGDFPQVWPEPWPDVVHRLQQAHTWDEMAQMLPDRPLAAPSPSNPDQGN